MNILLMAERVGFEPTVPLPVRRFSRPLPSTTRPPLRIAMIIPYNSLCRKADITLYNNNKIDMITNFRKLLCLLCCK